MGEKKQSDRQLELTFGAGEPLSTGRRAEPPVSTPGDESQAGTEQLMVEVCEGSNARKALKRVRRNGGAPGVDKMTVGQLPGFLRKHWVKIRERLLEGSYQPNPVRRVEIAKPSGGMRQLGIPCVLDRFVQQMLMQVLQERWDPTFSEHSYGFRPGRSQHQAVAQAQKYVEQGHGYVVDIDLESFFDRVNHDMLMGRVSKRIKDRRVIRLIRAFLNAGIMDGGLVSPPQKQGVPQGGPLSPLLSNLFLDDLDKELERRGHRFVRYADDSNIYVKSEKAGHRVMASIERFLAKKLKLKVNKKKSKVTRATRSKFLGFRFAQGRDGRVRRNIAPESLKRFKQRVRMLTGRTRGRSLAQLINELSQYLIGWRAYYGYTQMKGVLRNLDTWIRRRLRAYIWARWQTGRRRFSELVNLGARPHKAMHLAWRGSGVNGPWHLSRTKILHHALPNRFFEEQGLVSLAAK